MFNVRKPKVVNRPTAIALKLSAPLFHDTAPAISSMMKNKIWVPSTANSTRENPS